MKFVEVKRNTEDFQVAVEEHLIKSLCQNAFGSDFIPKQIEPVTSGRFNSCYRIESNGGDKVILRVAPSSQMPIFRHEQYLMRREASILEKICQASDRIPTNIFTDFSGNLIDRDYAFQPCFEGQLWSDLSPQLTEQNNEQLWSELGEITKRIHAIPGKKFGPPEPMQQYQSWGKAIYSWVSGMVDDLRELELPYADAQIFLELVSKGAPYLDEITHPYLVHGDLWTKNILIKKDSNHYKISAVLDAERGFWGDPAAEWIFTFLQIPSSFWEQYGVLNNGTETNKGTGAEIRRHIYEGRGAIQLCLEAWRFHFDDKFARNI